MAGSLTCVGVGMTLGAHISPIAKSHIEQAEKVYLLMSNGFVESWVASMNVNCESLQQFYQEGKNRKETYREMVDALVNETKRGKKVVAAFYGHPGVFACVAHRALSQVECLGLPAIMEPGISAEDCLYADLGIDPGQTGCIHYEASQFMTYKRNIDTAAHVVLWQVGFAGDQSHTKFSTSNDYKKVLVELLLVNYPADHQVILYEAKVLPIDKLRAEKIPLADLATAELTMQTTLVIPPSSKMINNDTIRQRLTQLDIEEQKPQLTLV